jgi:hypothetical protein
MLHVHHNYIKLDESLMNISGHRFSHKTSFVFLLSAGCQITGRLSGLLKIFKLVKLVEEVMADCFWICFVQLCQQVWAWNGHILVRLH